MATEYRLDVYSASGTKVAEITDFVSLSYRKSVNEPGLLTFSLLGVNQVINLLASDCILVVYRRNQQLGLSWTPDFTGILRKWRARYTDHEIYEATCPGIMTLLSWRIVAYKAGTADRSSFSNKKAETIMKTLVSYNAGSAATTGNGRIRNGAITGLSVQADGAHGNSLTINCAYDNLLDTLQTIAAVGGGDFDLVRTGAGTYEFRWYTGQLGTDRTASVLFALERGNMNNPVRLNDRLDERTVAIVGGQGEADARSVAVRTGADYSASNDTEIFVDARNTSDTAGLNTKGDARLHDTRALRKFSYSVTQTPACAYGVHYGLGDLVRAQYQTVNEAQKIIGITVGLEAGSAEQIAVETQAV